MHSPAPNSITSGNRWVLLLALFGLLAAACTDEDSTGSPGTPIGPVDPRAAEFPWVTINSNDDPTVGLGGKVFTVLSFNQVGHDPYTGAIRLFASCRNGRFDQITLMIPESIHHTRSRARIAENQTEVRWFIDHGLGSELTGVWTSVVYDNAIQDSITVSGPSHPPMAALFLAERTLTVELTFFPFGDTKQFADFSLSDFDDVFAQCFAN